MHIPFNNYLYVHITDSITTHFFLLRNFSIVFQEEEKINFIKSNHFYNTHLIIYVFFKYFYRLFIYFEVRIYDY